MLRKTASRLAVVPGRSSKVLHIMGWRGKRQKANMARSSSRVFPPNNQKSFSVQKREAVPGKESWWFILESAQIKAPSWSPQEMPMQGIAMQPSQKWCMSAAITQEVEKMFFSLGSSTHLPRRLPSFPVLFLKIRCSCSASWVSSSGS